MADVDKEIEQLDKQFEDYLGKFEALVCSLKTRDKYVSTNWINKLKQSKDSIEERKLRNRFINYFVSNLESRVNVFQYEPFRDIPAEFFGPLTGLVKYFPRSSTDTSYATDLEKQSYISDLFMDLTDKGSFLGQQPVPREGTFFILVVKKPNESARCQQCQGQ